jgi:hypothetical protein
MRLKLAKFIITTDKQVETLKQSINICPVFSAYKNFTVWLTKCVSATDDSRNKKRLFAMIINKRSLQCVFCDAETEFLNIISMIFRLRSLVFIPRVLGE